MRARRAAVAHAERVVPRNGLRARGSERREREREHRRAARARKKHTHVSHTEHMQKGRCLWLARESWRSLQKCTHTVKGSCAHLARGRPNLFAWVCRRKAAKARDTKQQRCAIVRQWSGAWHDDDTKWLCRRCMAYRVGEACSVSLPGRFDLSIAAAMAPPAVSGFASFRLEKKATTPAMTGSRTCSPGGQPSHVFSDSHSSVFCPAS